MGWGWTRVTTGMASLSDWERCGWILWIYGALEQMRGGWEGSVSRMETLYRLAVKMETMACRLGPHRAIQSQ